MEADITSLGLLEDDAIVLDESALELAALDHPSVELEPSVALLRRITERLAALAGGTASAASRADLLGSVFASEFGFRGDRETYDDPANTDLIRVLERRRGLPVTLSILYVAAARRLGWEADALNTPGHVLVRIGSPTEPVLIDPFDDGAVVGAARLAALLRQMLGPAASPSAEHLTPMTNRAVLVRLLLNQATRAEGAGDGARALVLYRRMTAIAPGHANGWWERARLEFIGGDAGAARASLSAMLEVTRDPASRAHVFAALDALSGKPA